jgi:hypothetical protein
VSRKRDRAVSETPIKSTKQSKISGPDAIQGLTQSISLFKDNICKVLAPDNSLQTPQRQKEAMKLAQQEDWLPKSDQLTFCIVLERDINAVDAYLVLDLEDQKFRQMWIQDKIDEYRSKRNSDL